MQASIRKKPGSADIAKDMRQMAQNLSDLDGLLEQIGDLVFAVLQESIQEGKAPSGEKWAKLANATIALKAKYGFPAQPLVRTGRLKNGIMVSIDSEKQISIGFAPELAAYARFHQEGAQNLPRRPLITALAPEDRERLEALIRAHIASGVEALQSE